MVFGWVSAIGATFYSVGISKDSLLRYEGAVKADKFLLLSHGTVDEVANAQDILRTTRTAELAAQAA